MAVLFCRAPMALVHNDEVKEIGREEFLKVGDVIIPDISWAPKESRQRIMDCTVENVKAYLSGKPVNVVNP